MINPQHLNYNDMKRLSLFMILLSVSVLAWAQHPSDYNAGGRFPQINADNSVTFRVNAPNAKAITVDLGGRYLMEKGADGFWTATTAPQVPEAIDDEVARRKLATLGVSIDCLTEEQHRYIYGE